MHQKHLVGDNIRDSESGSICDVGWHHVVNVVGRLRDAAFGTNNHLAVLPCLSAKLSGIDVVDVNIATG